MDKKLLPYLLFLSVLSLWCGAVIITPYLKSLGYEIGAKILYSFFSLSCHQLLERSPFIFGYQLPVCYRCAAIYFSMLFTTIFYPFLLNVYGRKLPSKWYIILACIPIALDGGTQLLTDYYPFLQKYGITLPHFILRRSTTELRILTGAIFGGVLPFYFIPLLNEIYANIEGSLKKTKKSA